MRITIPSAMCLALLSGCATTLPAASGAHARLKETIRVDGPKVTPLAVIEDSRCPQGVQCVWAGQVRLSARIDLGGGRETRVLTLGQPQQIADGMLTLTAVMPPRVKDRAIAPKDYRFAFSFRGGY